MRKLPLRFALVLAAFVCAAMTFASAQMSERQIPLEGAPALRLDVSGSIHLIAVAGARTVNLRVIDSGPSVPPMSVKVTHERNRLDVSISGPSESILPFAGASGYELQLTYPQNVKVDLREFSGRVHVDRVTAPMQIYDGDGNIVVDAAAASLTAEADSGDITASGMRSRVMLSTIDGNVRASLAPGWRGHFVRLEAQHGNLHLAVPAGFSGRYDLTTGAGRVDNPLHSDPQGPLVFMLAERGNLSVSRL